MANNNGRNLMVFAAVAILVLFVFNFFSGTRANYTMTPLIQGESSDGKYYSVNASEGHMVDVCALKNGGTGLASALLPKEVATQEDFGQFAPDDILKGQNFLNPRDQVGFPETIGGALRNANQQIRSEPQNPRDPVTIFNNSTIEPDQMRPQFEIGSGLA